MYGISGCGSVGMKPQRVRVDHLDPGDRLDREGEAGRAVQHRRNAAEAEYHIVRGERRAVAECDAVPQLELPFRGADRRPRYRQVRFGIELRIEPGQRR